MRIEKESLFLSVLAVTFCITIGRSFYERSYPPVTTGAKATVIAIAATGRDISSPVSYLFGRAPFFIIYDRAKRTYKAVPNKYLDAQHAAGLRSSQMVARMGVDAVCGNNVGFEPFRVFSQARIKVYTDLPPTVSDTIRSFPDGLTLLTAESVPSHFGITGSRKQIACSSFDVQANTGRIVQGKFLICFDCNYRVSAKTTGVVIASKCPKCGGTLHEVVAVASPLGAGSVKPKMRVL